ncbi:hypothetical protein, partial [Gardnerella vaginalis]|uniref:hypothetical protein n=1 Tax=Gardnerella vaginalis TaxID=2702 RepID=UPI0039F07C59
MVLIELCSHLLSAFVFSFCRFFACRRLFLYTAVKFLPLFAAQATFILHGCTVSAGIARAGGFSFTPLHSFGRNLAGKRHKLRA